MEKFTQKWAIVALLEQVAEGTEFYYTDFPLHITLAGVFKIDYDGMRLKKLTTQGAFRPKAIINNRWRKGYFWTG